MIKFKSNEIDKKQVNEILGLSKNILKILYILIIIALIFVSTIVFKEWKIWEFIKTILRVLAPLFLGIVIAWLLNPFVKWLEKKKIRRSIGSFFAYFILIGVIVLIIKSIIPLLYNQTIELVDNFPKIFSNVKEWVVDILGKFESKTINIDNIEKNIFERIDLLSKSLSNSLPSFILNTITNVVSYIGTFIIGLVIGFFLLLGCNNVSTIVLDFIPKRFRNSTEELCEKMNTSLRNYANGALIDAFVVFVVSSIAFAVIGLKAPLLFGLFCGLMNVIPYAGPYIGGAPAVIVGFSQGTGIGIAVLISIIVIQFLEGNILQTLIISKTTKLNPVTIIIGLLIFGHFFGIVGMLLSTPIIGVCKVIIKYFDDKYDLLNFN